MRITIIILTTLAALSGFAEIPGDKALWLRSDQVVADKNNMVASWKDLSGHQRDAIALKKENCPLLEKTDDTSSVVFDGKNSFLHSASGMEFNLSENYTIVMRYQPLTTQNGSGLFTVCPPSGAYDFNTPAALTIIQDNNGLSLIQGKIGRNAASISGRQFVTVVWVKNADKLDCYVNGNAVGQSSNCLSEKGNGGFSRRGYIIGARAQTGNGLPSPPYGNFKLSELIVYPRAVQEAERKAIEDYLNAPNYKITVSVKPAVRPAQLMKWSGRDLLTVQELNGAPAFFRNGQAVPALIADSKIGVTIRDGRLHIADLADQGIVISSTSKFKASQIKIKYSMEKSFAEDGEGSKVYFAIGDQQAGTMVYFSINSCAGASYFLVELRGAGISKVITRHPVKWSIKEPFCLDLKITDRKIEFSVNNTTFPSFPVPEITGFDNARLGAYRAAGFFDYLQITGNDGKTAFADDFKSEKKLIVDWQGTPLPGKEKTFAQAGIHIYTCDIGQLNTSMVAPGRYDWSCIGEYLTTLGQSDPEGLLIPRFQMTPPDWWIKQNPDQMMKYSSGINPGTRNFSFASFSSELWRKEVKKALADLLDYLARHPDGWRMAGINICYGQAHEWVYGFFDGNFDFSAVQLEGFKKWLIERYSTEEGLAAAWKQPGLRLSQVEIPSAVQRRSGELLEFYNPSTQKKMIDYFTYHCQVVADCLLDFASVIKENSDGRMFTIAFYGYVLADGGNLMASTGCHSAVGKVLDSKHIDALCSPHDYVTRYPGGNTINYTPNQSLRMHGKIMFDENDTRTHLSPLNAGFGRSKDEFESVNVLKRDFAYVLSQSMGQWFFSWGRGWFKDTALRDTIAQCYEISRKGLTMNRNAQHEIALVISAKSNYVMKTLNEYAYDAMRMQLKKSICRIGAPFDVILQEDLLDAPNYKLYIFINSFYLDDKERAMIHSTLERAKATALWFFAPGWITTEGYSDQAMSDLVGIKLASRKISGRMGIYPTDMNNEIFRGLPPSTVMQIFGSYGPMIYSVDKDALELAVVGDHFQASGNGFTSAPGMMEKTQKSGWRSIWCAIPVLPATVVRNIAKTAGVHIYADTDDFVCANNFMVSVHAAYDGVRKIKLPKKFRLVTEAYSNKLIAENADEFKIFMKRNETGLWILE